MKSNIILLIVAVTGFFPCTLYSQDLASQKHTHQGIFIHAIQSKQIFKEAFAPATSKFKTGFVIGFYQHFDLGERLQLRGGAGISAYKVDMVDYSPQFGSDLDSLFGIDIKKSYFENKAEILQINVPINLRYKLWGAENHGFAAFGLEGRIIVGDNITSYIQESGLSYRMIDLTRSFESRKINVAAHLEFGYEFEIAKSRKLNVSILAKYSLKSQFDSVGFPSSAMYHILNGRALDVGVGVGVVF